MRKALLIAGLSTLAVTAAALALPAGGVLKGVVVSSSNLPVPAARVFLQSADGTAPHVIRTNKEGRFRSASLRAGLYDARANAGKMWSEWHHNIVVRNGGEADITLRLTETPHASDAAGKARK